MPNVEFVQINAMQVIMESPADDKPTEPTDRLAPRRSL